jgi:hypothetical protein
MNLIELEPIRVNALNNWWLKPEAGDLIACLEKSAQKAMMEFAELRTKSKGDSDNPQFAAAAELKLVEATEFETAVKVLKGFFPDGPFIQRIEL